MNIDPESLPKYWRDETSGVLEEAVHNFLSAEKLQPKNLERLKAYCAQWVGASCWQVEDPFALERLREQIYKVGNKKELVDWLDRALLLGIDPL